MRGDEGDFSVSARIMVVERPENFEPTGLLGDNYVDAVIPVVAKATYAVQV